MAWQKATGYGRRSIVEAAIKRYQHIIGLTRRVHSEDGQDSEVALATRVLHQMVRIAKPSSMRLT